MMFYTNSKKEILLSNFTEKEKKYLSWIYDNLTLEVNTNYTCNLNCFGCNRLLEHIQDKKRDIKLDDVKRSVDEIKKERINLHHAAIVGGEPTLHPKIFDIFKILNSLNCEVRVLSNEYDRRTRKITKELRRMGAVIHSSNKSGNKKDTRGFFSHTCFPKEIKRKDNSTLLCCPSPGSECGFCLNHRGVYICHFSATIDYYFNLGIAKKRFTDLTPDVVMKEIKTVCMYCGKVCTPKIKNGYFSPEWKQAIRKR